MITRAYLAIRRHLRTVLVDYPQPASGAYDSYGEAVLTPISSGVAVIAAYRRMSPADLRYLDSNVWTTEDLKLWEIIPGTIQNGCTVSASGADGLFVRYKVQGAEERTYEGGFSMYFCKRYSTL